MSGSGSCVTRHEFVVAQKAKKMKSLCFSRQLFTPLAEGEGYITQDLMEEKTLVLLLLINVSIEIENIASMHLLDKD